jgi:hypothetical protein
LAKFKGRCHLPLRGKLGWMTPHIRCENDAGYETCFRGSRSQAGAPFFARSIALTPYAALIEIVVSKDSRLENCHSIYNEVGSVKTHFTAHLRGSVFS